MKSISFDAATNEITKYIEKMAREGNLNPKKDDFKVVLPLEKHQAIIVTLNENNNGERHITYDAVETVFVMKKLKNTVLNAFAFEGKQR